MSGKSVKLYLKGSWYKVYNDDAKIVSYLTGYELFELEKGKPLVGYPYKCKEKVESYLIEHKINYTFPRKDSRNVDFGDQNQYETFLDIAKNGLPTSHVRNKETSRLEPKGSFEVKYHGEEPMQFTIDETISADAELVKLVLKHDENEQFYVNEYLVTLIRKDISF